MSVALAKKMFQNECHFTFPIHLYFFSPNFTLNKYSNFSLTQFSMQLLFCLFLGHFSKSVISNDYFISLYSLICVQLTKMTLILKWME